ncbi:hypothetical protein PYCCODRAFT_715595 [Trametes coccinea BRFM310]|uniref:Uncharacterized protein n=1 Tax=Trametes coccinea (strain BRFM310) TaxID=1353009 RepID=A0A1Y2IG35_TRAC3|nr:hypothetical protein PYCCODRAFT_715595 [Trametes coccinea BRFM310]
MCLSVTCRAPQGKCGSALWMWGRKVSQKMHNKHITHLDDLPNGLKVTMQHAMLLMAADHCDGAPQCCSRRHPPSHSILPSAAFAAPIQHGNLPRSKWTMHFSLSSRSALPSVAIFCALCADAAICLCAMTFGDLMASVLTSCGSPVPKTLRLQNLVLANSHAGGAAPVSVSRNSLLRTPAKCLCLRSQLSPPCPQCASSAHT